MIMNSWPNVLTHSLFFLAKLSCNQECWRMNTSMRRNDKTKDEEQNKIVIMLSCEFILSWSPSTTASTWRGALLSISAAFPGNGTEFGNNFSKQKLIKLMFSQRRLLMIKRARRGINIIATIPCYSFVISWKCELIREWKLSWNGVLTQK